MTQQKSVQFAKRQLKKISRRDSFFIASIGFTPAVLMSGFNRMYTVQSVDMIFVLVALPVPVPVQV